MRLITLHRILVTTAILFCGYFVWLQVRTWRAEGGGSRLLLAIGFTLAALVLTWYLANLKRLVRFDPPEQPEPPPR